MMLMLLSVLMHKYFRAESKIMPKLCLAIHQSVGIDELKCVLDSRILQVFATCLIDLSLPAACFSVHVRGSEYIPLLGSNDPSSFLVGVPDSEL